MAVVESMSCNMQPSRRWKSMLIHQGWFTALFTQHLLNSQYLEFEICIFPREATPSHYFPLREDSSRVLAWGLHGQVRQLRYGSCHYPTAATKCNVQPSRATENPVGGKACSSTKGGLLRLYPTLTQFTTYVCLLYYHA